MNKDNVLPVKTFSGFKEPLIPTIDLMGFQRESYEDFLNKDLTKLFKSTFPIEDANKRFSIEFISSTLGEPRLTPKEAKKRLSDYAAPLKVVLKLTNKVTNLVKEEELLLADVPVMTPQHSFIINGKEKIIISQIVQSDGIKFYEDKSRGVRVFGAKIRPKKGSVWTVFESDASGKINVRIDQSTKKVPLTTFIRAFGPETKEAVLRLFADDEQATKAVKETFTTDPANIMDEVWINIYKIMRGGDLVSAEKAMERVLDKYSEDKYDISELGRLHFNKRFGLPTDAKALSKRAITLEDIVLIVKEIARLNSTKGATEDDIDHLGYRRIRSVGELVKEQITVSLARMKKNAKDKMSTVDPMNLNAPSNVISLTIFKSTINSFFNTNQLSQLLKQKNLVDEVEHFRTVSALGTGGLMRRHASLDVRDVHYSHYGRLCPYHSPEGANVGLVLHFSLYTRLNSHGIMESPYLKVVKGKITDEVVYLDAIEEEKYKISSRDVDISKDNKIMDSRVQARYKGNFAIVDTDNVDLIDVSMGQVFSVAASLVPFANNNVAVRTEYGTKTQRQAVPCLNPETPIVATGYEGEIGKVGGRVLMAVDAGEVVEVDSTHITIKGKTTKTYELDVFSKTNDKTFSFHQRPVVKLGDKVKKGDLLADIASTKEGQVAIGKNLRVAFVCQHGANYEDAIVISRRLVEDDTLTSLVAKEFTADVRETKLGPDETAADIPNVSEARLRNLDANGIIRVGSEVEAGDILVGKITQKGESQLSAEEKLLQSIFGEKIKDVKDTSLRLPAGEKGRVIDVQVRDRNDGHNLTSGVIRQIKVVVADVRKIQEGDKLTNRHGNKGVISKVLPSEDMPYTEDGHPVDIVLSPLGVPSRKNIGQILEMHLGMCASRLGYQAVIPPLTSITDKELKGELKAAGMPETGRVPLYDGRTGEKYHGDVAVGVLYILKLEHMVEDKIHARSTGKYSLITQQPVGGRSRFGGQRLGEMEVEALVAHGAAYTLREMLTIKSDDVQGRAKAYDSIVRQEPIIQTNTPATFNVLLHVLRGLCLNIETQRAERI